MKRSKHIAYIYEPSIYNYLYSEQIRVKYMMQVSLDSNYLQTMECRLAFVQHVYRQWNI